jgi:hypothetical protein
LLPSISGDWVTEATNPLRVVFHRDREAKYEALGRIMQLSACPISQVDNVGVNWKTKSFLSELRLLSTSLTAYIVVKSF